MTATGGTPTGAPWRRRRGADEEPRVRRGVRIEPGDRPSEELEEIGDAAADRTAHVVRIFGFQVDGVRHVPCEHAVAESGSEAFDLALDRRGAIDGRTRRHVAIRVSRLLSRR